MFLWDSSAFWPENWYGSSFHNDDRLFSVVFDTECVTCLPARNTQLNKFLTGVQDQTVLWRTALNNEILPSFLSNNSWVLRKIVLVKF